MPDLTAADLDAAVRTIAGSARSMGLDVEGSDMATRSASVCKALARRSSRASSTPIDEA